MDRTGGVNRTLVERVPGSVPFLLTSIASGPEAFNSNQFQQGFSAGPKIDLIYHGDSGYSAELSYFNIFNQTGTKAIGPDNPADWLVMKAPGGFWQTQDFPYQAMAWQDTTSLYSAEANGRLALSSRVTVLAGFRWFQLNDTLLGTLTPPDRTQPAWKNGCTLTNCQLSLVTEGNLPAGNYPAFWNTNVVNNLYGFQIGVDGKIWEFGRFSLGGQAKIGLFDDNAWQSAGVSVRKTVYSASATANNAAFASRRRLAAEISSYRAIGSKNRLRGALARRHRFGAGTDQGDGYGFDAKHGERAHAWRQQRVECAVSRRYCRIGIFVLDEAAGAPVVHRPSSRTDAKRPIRDRDRRWHS